MDAAERHEEERIGLVEQELRQVGSKVRIDKLGKAVANAAAAIASRVGFLSGSGKMRELEQTNEDLHQEVARRGKGIDTLKVRMQEMQERHGKQVRNLQSIHNQKLGAKDGEISRLNTLLEEVSKWFLVPREMLRMEKLCVATELTENMIDCLLIKKEAIQRNDKTYSEKYRRKFEIRDSIFKVEKNPTGDSKLVLTISR